MKVKTEQHHVKLADIVDELAENFENKRIIQEREEALSQSNISNSVFRGLFAIFENRKPVLTSDEKKKAEKSGVIYG